MSEPTGRRTAPDTTGAEEEALDEVAARAPPDIADLVAKGDTAGLLDLARAYRAGTGGAPRDLKKCFECYSAAAELGSAEAQYSAALFYLSGGVVAQDSKQGAALLRTAAEGGWLHAKVYLANLYELGVHYAKDEEKANVWYRSVARAAGVTEEPESPEYDRAMADLGCVRYCLAIAEDAATPEDERERFLGKAKAHGYQLFLRQERAATQSTPSAPTPTPSPSLEEKAGDAALQGKVADKRAKPKVAGSGLAGLTAFLYASLFMAVAVGAGVLATAGARELLAQGTKLPLIDAQPERVYLAAFVLFGVLPALLVYRAGAVARAVLVAAGAGAAGYALWGSRTVVVLAERLTQSAAFAAAAFLATLFVVGLLGGAKPRKPAPTRTFLTK